MVSATQPVLGTGTALETPLCRAAHGNTTHQSVYCCWSPSIKRNSWEREHRGEAPVWHAGTPPPTGKSALSAWEETPAAPSFTRSEKKGASVVLSHPGAGNLRGTQV